MKYIALLLLFCLLLACKEERKPDSETAARHLPAKKELLRLADSIVKAKANENIWNLSEVDGTAIFIAEDYFTSSKTKSAVVLINGSAGLSAGSADNLLMLLEYHNNRYSVSWAGQTGDFDNAGIKDLTNDGVKEIVSENGMVWMGGCYDYFTIFNFKGGERNKLFTAESVSVIDCGLEDYGEKFFAQGDTLENVSVCKIIPVGKAFAVQQARTLRLINGGTTNQQIIAKLKVVIDTIVTPIR
jgi:hypothetical protein